jgi:hypothetical protein
VVVWVNGSLNMIIKHQVDKKEREREEIQAQAIKKMKAVSIILPIFSV